MSPIQFSHRKSHSLMNIPRLVDTNFHQLTTRTQMDKSVERECKREKAAIVRTLSKENFYNSVKLQLYMLQIAPLLYKHY